MHFIYYMNRLIATNGVLNYESEDIITVYQTYNEQISQQ